MTKESCGIGKSYPCFIPNKPCGIDKSLGKPQYRLADAIISHFKKTDAKGCGNSMPRIIGLEGSWGSGKSNVIKYLEGKLNENYFFFIYDAWGHQEDLQRRSILELLTKELLDNGILSGETEIKIKGGKSEKVSWEKKLQY